MRLINPKIIEYITKEEYISMSDKSHLILDDIEHAATKSMHSGIFKRVKKFQAVNAENKIYKTSLEHSPALMKIIDEVICNACDATQKTAEEETAAGKKHTVHIIKVNFNDDWSVSVYNTGNGIPIYKHEEASKLKERDCYWPEACFSLFRTGSNLKIESTHSVAGVNGYGVKIMCVHSDWVELETVHNKQIYTQEFKNGLRDIQLPVIEKFKITKQTPSHTRVKFLPKYKERFEYQKDDLALEKQEIIDFIRYRLVHLSCFLGNRTKVFFQDSQLTINDTKALLGLWTPDIKEAFHIKTKEKDHFLDYSVLVRRGKYITSSVVNGILVKDGTHITYLKKKINDELKKINKTDKKIDTTTNLIIISSAWLSVDNWGTQTKDTLAIPISELKGFEIEGKVIEAISKKLLTLGKEIDISKIGSRKIDRKIIHDLVTPAKKKNPNNTCFIVEGESAKSLIISGLNSKQSDYTFDNTTIVSARGVPQNSAKTTHGVVDDKSTTTSIDDDDDDGDDLYEQETATQRFWESKVFGTLAYVLGLDSKKTYKDVLELKSLNYRKIIIAVDQDLDGRGNICSLILQMFYRFWPHLYDHDYIRYWNSPIIRIIKNTNKTMVEEFKYENTYNKWLEKRSGNLDGLTVMYIKGLATHDSKYVKGMFQKDKFNMDTLILTTNRLTKSFFNRYFGVGKECSDMRKEILQTPVKYLTDEEVRKIENNNKLTCNRHLDINTKEFQIYAGKRTLCSAIDGMTPVRRKIFSVAYEENIYKPMKIFQIAAMAALKRAYHHGDKSANDAASKMGMKWYGSNFLPVLRGEGQFGTRNHRGTDMGQARYIAACLNRELIDLLFNKEDNPLLNRQSDEGQLIEPEYYIPSVPLAIMEYRKAVAPGWCLNVFPRDIKFCCQELINLSQGKNTRGNVVLPPNSNGFKGKITFDTLENGQNQVTMIGTYRELNDVSIIIDELPINVCPHKLYLKLAEQDAYVVNVRNYSENTINIEIDFKPCVIAKLKAEGKLEAFLGIRSTIVENINFINEHGVLEHFDNAYNVLLRCFKLNKKKHGARIEREDLLLRYMIFREKNILTFMEKDEVRNIYRKKDTVIDEILTVAEYAKINSAAINTHAKYTTEELNRELLDTSKQSFDYLKQVNFGQVSDENIVKRTAKLGEFEKRYEELQKLKKEKPFPGASVYISDLNGIMRGIC